MRNIASRIIAAACQVGVATGAVAGPISKCVINGAVTYQQGPCPAATGQARRDPTLEELNAAEKKRRAMAASAPVASRREETPAPMPTPAPAPAGVAGSFSCDGRQHCSQMRSCEEARFFLANCPGARMDGDRNGIPCEKQWCSR